MLTQTKKINRNTLIKRVEKALLSQGYAVEDKAFSFRVHHNEEKARNKKRAVHRFSRAERISENINFIESLLPEFEEYMRDGREINIEKIKPRLIEVESDTFYSDLFRWWNLVWWSLPYERSYGRQMRFVIWDSFHEAPIGLIGLQSPILNWSVRDNYLGLATDQRDLWVNQSLNAQRLGALPPYNKLLGGKLVAYLMTSDVVRKRFSRKYKDYKTLLLNRKIPSNLLFITTTGAYGKSSVFNRLKFDGDKICDFIGYTNGSGSFHIPNTLYEGFVTYLRSEGFKAGREFGNGPSAKMKIIVQAMNLLGFKNGVDHGIRRSVYLFPLVKNLADVIREDASPRWHQRSISGLTEHWKSRWGKKRAEGCQEEKIYFSKQDYVEEIWADLKDCKKLARQSL